MTNGPIGTCVACGQSLINDRFGAPLNYVESKLAPGHVVKICMSARRGPKLACERKARQDAELCPGCGKKGFSPGEICTECHSRIARENEQTNKNFKWYVINARNMMPYLAESQQQEGSVPELSLLLARVAAGEGRVNKNAYKVSAAGHIPTSTEYNQYYGDCAAVELCEDQVEAMKQLSGAIQKLMNDQLRKGRQEGLSLLVQLGRGEVTVDQFEDRKTRLLSEKK